MLKIDFYELEAKNLKKKLEIDPLWCKLCGICVEYCPVKILTIKDYKIIIEDSSKCTSCGLCELRCPDYAIYLSEKNI